MSREKQIDALEKEYREVTDRFFQNDGKDLSEYDATSIAEEAMDLASSGLKMRLREMEAEDEEALEDADI